MISSMTGFGKAVVTFPDKTVKTEIRTLNSKNLDLSLKVPIAYREYENQLRNLLSTALERGKVELVITLECNESNAAYSINTPLLRRYFNEIKEAAETLDVSISDDFLPDLLRLPDILRPMALEPDEEEWKQILKSVNEAVEQVAQYRSSEGKHLHNDIVAREQHIRRLLAEIDPFEKERIENIKSKIIRSLKEIAENVKTDQNRFEQEVIFYLEKLDITEEKVRLHKHLDYFTETLELEGSGGKKLGFIAQEIGREINTIGSKANDASIQRIVVQMKDELEKIKEQLMNVL